MLKDLEGEKDDGKQITLDRVIRSGAEGSSLVDAALPYLKQLDPQRLKAVLLALKRLEMIQAEGAVLMAPEFVIGP